MSDVLRVGTDCSGIEAPIQALRQLGIPFRHVFSSEIDKFCIQSIKANYEPEILFGDPDGPFKDGDITKRNIDDVPDMDLYVCGFPCQPFSDMGTRSGLFDSRGTVYRACVDVIRTKEPRCFVLENVRGLLTNDGGATWKTILADLHELSESCGYTLSWKILNTRDYGLPQNRERVYIVGTRGTFIWPTPIPLTQRPLDCVDWSDKRTAKTSERNLRYLNMLSFKTLRVVLSLSGEI